MPNVKGKGLTFRSQFKAPPRILKRDKREISGGHCHFHGVFTVDVCPKCRALLDADKARHESRIRRNAASYIPKKKTTVRAYEESFLDGMADRDDAGHDSHLE